MHEDPHLTAADSALLAVAQLLLGKTNILRLGGLAKVADARGDERTQGFQRVALHRFDHFGVCVRRYGDIINAFRAVAGPNPMASGNGDKERRA